MSDIAVSKRRLDGDREQWKVSARRGDTYGVRIFDHEPTDDEMRGVIPPEPPPAPEPEPEAEELPRNAEALDEDDATQIESEAGE